MSRSSYRILLRNLMYLRNFEPVIRQLADAGHDIFITTSVYDRKVPPELRRVADDLAEGYPNLRFGFTHERDDMWSQLARKLRSYRDALRYRRPEYADAPALAGRALSRIDPVSRFIVNLPLFRNNAVNNTCSWLIAQCDRAIPPSRTIMDELRATQPDALIVSPMVDLQSEQVDWVRAARALGIPTCLLVASWDNLTNKGLIQARPDRVIVWNRFQKEEAASMHGVPEDAVSLTGAQLYDHWFERKPKSTYPEFCARFGFNTDKPTLLYCGSSVFIARNEAEFVERWLAKVRSADDPVLRNANILIRPHPMHQVPFEQMDLTDQTRVAIHPRKGGMPVVEDAKADYYDALYHCSAVVGINTSALIEASILGKRSFTVTDPAYRRTQEGTLHFHYLIDGGILRKAADFDEHIRHLVEELSADKEDKQALGDFVESFLRPHGLDKPATPILFETLTTLPAVKPTSRSSAGHWPLRVLLLPIAWFANQLVNLPRRILTIMQRILRRSLFKLAQIKRRDAIELLAISQPIDYEPKQVEILATAPKEVLTRNRSVLQEPWTVHWIENAVKPDDVFYDIGANVGIYSLLVAAVHDEQVRSFAFEPGFATYAALCRNIIHNGFETCIVPMPSLLHRQTGHTVFKYRSTDSGAARHAVGAQGLESKDFKETKPAYEQMMLTIDLDTLISDYGLPVPAHIKLDVDGPELEILQGARKTLANPALKSVMVELDDKKTRRTIVALLEDAGLSLAAEFDKAFSRGDSHFDAFFARDREALADVMKGSPLKAAVDEAA